MFKKLRKKLAERRAEKRQKKILHSGRFSDKDIYDRPVVYGPPPWRGNDMGKTDNPFKPGNPGK